MTFEEGETEAEEKGEVKSQSSCTNVL